MRMAYHTMGRRALLVLASLALALSQASGQVPYNSYSYSVWDESVPSAPVYEPDAGLNGYDLGVGGFKSPRDMALSAKGELYVLDSGNHRIVVLDANLRLLRVIDHFSLDGKTRQLIAPYGIFVDRQDTIYLADRDAQLVLIMDQQGKIQNEIGKPKSDLIPKSTAFQPEKVLVDEAGVIYVLSYGLYQGALSFDRLGNFQGFFGANTVARTNKLLADRIWRRFYSKKQREAMFRYVPTGYSNFTIDRDGFIYTVSNYGDDSQKGQVKKMNPLSKNILFAGRKPNLMYFGDWEQYYSTRLEKSNLVALDVDKDLFINVLDYERGRVFQYNQNCNIIAIFGGPGEQLGTFKNPVAIKTVGDRIVVLDEAKASLTSFRLTTYGRIVHRAAVLYEEGKYEQALEPWRESLKYDRNNRMAMRGIGQALTRNGLYEEAMRVLKEGRLHGLFSDAFREYRTLVLKRNFSLVAILVVLLIASPFVISFLRKRYGKKRERVVYLKPWQFPFHLVLHPFKGFEELKDERKGSLLAANLILIAYFIMNIVEFQCFGFIFNGSRLDQMNVLNMFVSTIGVFFLLTVSNWGICTLFDGKGSFREIWIFAAYALMTQVLTTLPLVLVSNFLSDEEGMFLDIAYNVVQYWTIVQIVVASMAVHRYSLGKSLLSLLFTIVGALLIVILIILFISLGSQVYSFLRTIFQEILLRT